MTIGERLNKLRPYVLGFRFSESSPLVDCYFKDYWIINNSNEIFFAATDTECQYICYTSNPSISIDNLLDYIENLIKYNLDEEIKVELFKEKMQDLKKIFENNDLKTLQKLKIVFGDVDKELPFQPTKPIQPIVQEINTAKPVVMNFENDIKTTDEINNFTKKEIETQPTKVVKPVCRCVGSERCSVCLGIDEDE